MYSHHNDRYAARQRRDCTPAPIAVRQRGTDYTFFQAGYQLRLKPIAFWVTVGTFLPPVRAPG